ncbi:LPS export ABC transporter periplasmic protein LptC [Edaphocola aurantiacus]|uniref:LPS export ABC transporter periplasmic protein LptC n=1 Tax=Edaphocola aurantiacus TaxID=2601682 RepID=UPI001C963D71|nr:LPS export ABC transporter periplasmic protein LptC [Edaphocola aurantiacus]
MTCLALIPAGCKEDSISQSNKMVTKEEMLIDRADSVTVILSKEGHTKARLRTKEFIQNEEAKPPYLDMNKGLKVEFYNDSMKVESVLTAKTARFYTQSSNILVQDSVLVVNDKGEQLKTQQMVWNNDLQKFYTQKPVQIIRGTSITYGTGLEANRDFSWIRIFNQTGTIPVEKDQMPPTE